MEDLGPRINGIVLRALYRRIQSRRSLATPSLDSGMSLNHPASPAHSIPQHCRKLLGWDVFIFCFAEAAITLSIILAV